MHAKSKIKDSSYSLAAVIALAAVTVFAIFGAPFAAAAFVKSEKVTVVLDAGHGGADGGVVGARTGIKESVLNLKVAQIVGEYLSAAGFDVVYTRTNEMGLYTGDYGSGKKREDMEKRAAIINRADPAAAVSIHMNKYTESYRRGAQVFFDKNSAPGREFARVMQDELNAELNVPDVGKGFAPLTAEKYILQCTSAPIIIVECGFLSNPQDESNLVNPQYRARLGQVIFGAVVKYLSR